MGREAEVLAAKRRKGTQKEYEDGIRFATRGTEDTKEEIEECGKRPSLK
jgi:hypothetical protein